MSNATVTQAIWIRGPQLRKRWGDMATATFYNRLQKGLIPKPQYPFGPDTPYWAMSAIEAFEKQAETPQELASTPASPTAEVTA